MPWLFARICPNGGSNPPLIACRIDSLWEKKLDSPSQEQLKTESADLSAATANITAVKNDLAKYLANIAYSKVLEPKAPLNTIPDPLDHQTEKNLQLKKYQGRQVAFGVYVVNEVGISRASAPTTTQPKSIVTITVLFADPKFEVSAGALFSTLPNRSFANITTVTENSSGAPTQGNVVISQSISRPTVVPFAAGNFRVGNDFALMGARREAFYITGTVGLNPNNSLAEFGVGPSISWRSLMFSALYDWGHDVRLTQGEYVGEVWCDQSAANGSIPKCSGSPPSPSTEKYWKGVFAFGLSVRIPSIFGGGGSSSGK
jgi:hypothetical protein